MARVVLIGNLAQITGGVAEFDLPATSIKQLVQQLAERHPALGPHLEDGVAVAIDGQIFQDALLEPIGPDSEVFILPKIAGGSDFLDLRDHVIVITGAASGMGQAIARAASREGARVVLSDVDGARLKATAAELSGEVRWQPADVSRIPEIEAVFELTEREFGRIDGLVTCAGIITTLPLLDVTSEEWDRVFAVNAKGTFFTVQAALRRMLPRRHGRIVTIGSDSYKLGGGRIANIPYAATKGAVVTMTKGFARTLVGTGIRINCVNPGPCDTPMHAPLTPEQRAMVTGRIPLGRFGLPAEIANAVLFLLSDAASFVYGESFNVDGGVLME